MTNLLDTSILSMFQPFQERTWVPHTYAMVLATIAEYQLPFTMAPVLVNLAKALSKDQKALNALSMARTTASYKMQYGLAETLHSETIEKMKVKKFSLNMDESTSGNLHRVLTVLVSYFDECEVLVEHLFSSSLIKREVTAKGKERIKTIQHDLSKKKMTDDGKKRKESVCLKIFKHRRYTKLISNLYISVLPLFKKYVMLFEMKEPAIHTLYEEQKKLMSEFLACFIKVEFLKNLTGKELKNLDVSKHHVKPLDIFMGSAVLNILGSSKGDPVMKEFLMKVEKGYEECAAYLQKKLPLDSPLLKAITSIDPLARQHSIFVTRMKKLPGLVTNVLQDEELESFHQEVLKYQVDKMLPSPLTPDDSNIRCDHYWATVDKTGRYPMLCKMAKALLSCFHGPQVESSFSNMGDIIDAKSNRMNIRTFSAFQSVRYSLRAKGKSGIDAFQQKDFLHVPVNYKLCQNMRSSAKNYKRYQEEQSTLKEANRRKLDMEEKMTESKKSHRDEEAKKAAKALKLHRETILKRLAEKKRKEKRPVKHMSN
ncbi:hypothetical protein KUTeg_022208 [Tegillarca granosa]|uniref:HAT C-terminal dimerisation domain-containing protein n=1 Tax=Tegillarca granosa TaxID=220873 RepID=A0ABQ9E8H6_TEGGR|nr:hypothetical protein KUTeg_022208 [Tegillarca granosa]